MVDSQTKILYKILVVLSVLTINVKTYAQNTWKQGVDYHINVSLDDHKHMLNGNIEIAYKNNSNSTLLEIWMHVWPNAYKSNETAFAIQQLENRSTNFHFSKDSVRGYIDSLNFMVNGVKVDLITSMSFPDIVKLILPSPLPPGGAITISTPFRVKLPNSFSRMGHVKQSYQVSQWYPKPAVFDHKGWHPMPYLDQGEFYSEYANYDVKISLPANYVVGSTGELQNEEEKIFLDNISNKTRLKKEYPATDSFPASSNEIKTLHYIQNNVHDFAWFADKRYNVLSSEVELPESKRKVKTYVMFLNSNSKIWTHADTFINNAIYYYSLWNGDYPYNYCTAVDGALSAGGGMEYPMVTVIGETDSKKSLDRVIAHEVGHNWFYGIIGSNEREHGWMDEGINSFYENRYMRVRYNDPSMLSNNSKNPFTHFFGLDYFPRDYDHYLVYQISASQGKAQAIETHSEQLTQLNYAAVMYFKTSLVFKYLEQYLGVSRFDSIMHNYYSKWKFNHPYPEDLRKEFELFTGENFDWFFGDIINYKEDPNFKVISILKENEQLRVKVSNNTEIAAPAFVSSIDKNGKLIETLKTAPFKGSIYLYFDNLNVEKIVVDPLYIIPESNRNDNSIKTSGILKKTEPLRLQFFAGLNRPDRTNIFFTPTVGYNVSDGFLTGIALYNSVFPFKNTEYLIMPMYGFNSKRINGTGFISHYYYPKNFEQIRNTISFNSFSTDYNKTELPYSLYYERFSRYSYETEITLKKKYARSSIRTRMSYRFIYTSEQSEYNGGVSPTSTNTIRNSFYNQLKFERNNNRIINPNRLNVLLEYKLNDKYSPNYTKFFVSYKQKLNYSESKKGIDVRVFAGTVLTKSYSTNQSNYFSLSGNNDYTFDKAFFDRYNLYRNQFHELDGAFKSNTFTGTVKNLIGINVKAPLKIKFPIGVFADAAYSSANEKINNLNFNYDAGIYIPIVNDIFEVYFPIVYETNGIPIDRKTQLVRFILDFQAINPFKLKRSIDLLN